MSKRNAITIIMQTDTARKIHLEPQNRMRGIQETWDNTSGSIQTKIRTTHQNTDQEKYDTTARLNLLPGKYYASYT